MGNSLSHRRAMIEQPSELSIFRQCQLLGVGRSTYYHDAKPCSESAENLAIMLEIDKLYLEFPYFGARRMLAHLPPSYQFVNIKRIRRLMHVMGLEAIYQRPKTRLSDKEHLKYPYLLRNVTITHPNHVWSTDITYVPMPHGYMYLCAVMDWYSRMILSWNLSNTMTTEFCVQTLKSALEQYPQPRIFNTDQGSQFTSTQFTEVLKNKGIQISMDGKGRATDNVYIERFWRDIKYNCIYLYSFDTVQKLYEGIEAYIYKHCFKQRHSSLGYQFPADVYQSGNSDINLENAQKNTIFEKEKQKRFIAGG